MLSKSIKESAIAAIQVCLTLYFLFFFLRDRVRVLKAIRWFVPLTENETDTLFRRINDTIHATFYGMIALSALQGVLAGLMFWWLGVPSPWLWALVAAVFAFVPVVDTFVLWLPAAVYLVLEGRWGEALGIATLGAILVRAIENFLYPVVVKDRLKVSSMSIFMSLLGGVLLFGWCGLVLGPSSSPRQSLSSKSVPTISASRKLRSSPRPANPRAQRLPQCAPPAPQHAAVCP